MFQRNIFQVRIQFPFQGAEKQYYISKRCATEEECEREIRANMPLCHYLWYEDWKCAECCQGDRCNYYVTVSILSFGKLHCLPLVYHSLLTQKLSLITVGSFQPNTQQIPCLGLNDSIISSNSNITVNKLMYIIIFSFLQCCIAKVDLLIVL